MYDVDFSLPLEMILWEKRVEMVKRGPMTPLRRRGLADGHSPMIGVDELFPHGELVVRHARAKVRHPRRFEGTFQQRHVRLFGRAVAFTHVAMQAREHKVLPRVAAAARLRQYVIDRKLRARKMFAAILAG